MSQPEGDSSSTPWHGLEDTLRVTRTMGRGPAHVRPFFTELIEREKSTPF